jgi:formylglycine-generating enzyme required for sulfatase activity
MRKQMTGLKIVVLDCCRNNPFAGTRSWARSRSGGGGLAQVTEADLPEGTMLVFSGEPGQEVPDGAGDHSPFAEALLGEMKGSGQAPVLTVFTGVATKVKGRQKPWIKFDGTGRSLHAFSTVALMTRGVPVAVEAAESDPKMSEAEIERRAKEMAEKLVAEAMRQQRAPVMPTPAPAAPTMRTETPKPMVKTDPAPESAFPADRGMEGSRAGEVRIFGGIEMVWCPPGEFLMGSPEVEEGREDVETQHRVTLTRGFWMAKTETTQGHWEAITRDNPSKYKGEDFPVETVSWGDVEGWIGKMNEKTPMPSGWKWSLPTEAQWEYACRAGTSTVFSFGNVLDGTQANCSGYFPYGTTATGPSLGSTTGVGSYPANAWGLHDMHGNVREWCADWYAKYSDEPVTDPEGPKSHFLRIIRGGSWSCNAQRCRSAYRLMADPDNLDSGMGFRLALVPAPAPAAPTMRTETPKPMVKTDPAPESAYPADRGMEGSRAGEVREFGGIEMVWCPPGEFWMGSPEDEAGRFEEEKQHRVTLTRGFWMAKTETTQGKWEAIAGDNPSEFKGEDFPVETVSWDDVEGWIGKMNEKTPMPSGWKWSLPTEAQWEYACRAGTETAFAGTGELDEMGWYSANVGTSTEPVGTKKANDWGLHDMHGNVREWCADWHEYYEDGPVTDPENIESEFVGVRVCRGGALWDSAKKCRSAMRDGILPADRYHFLGFRPALVPSIR